MKLKDFLRNIKFENQTEWIGLLMFNEAVWLEVRRHSGICRRTLDIGRFIYIGATSRWTIKTAMGLRGEDGEWC